MVLGSGDSPMASHRQIDPKILERCRLIATATWSDALDALGLKGVMDGLPVRTEGGRIAGAAITIREEAAALGTYALKRFDVGGIIAATPSGAIPVVTINGAEVSTFGGLAARAAVKRGIPGIVIDGGCRDIGEIRAAGMYVASRHVTPRSGKRRIRVVAIGEPVTCGSVSVNSGDCVIADETGVVVVPADRLDEALTIAEQLAGKDRIFEDELSAGAEFGSVATRLEHL
jgi:3-hexulose-6-phosphate synthase/6-phospho-3-hexuloisomerase